jgi:hypothetical protein
MSPDWSFGDDDVQENGEQDGGHLEPHGAIRGQDHGAANGYRADPSARPTNTNVAQVRSSCNTALDVMLSKTNSVRMPLVLLGLCNRQSNRILEQTEKIGRGYGFMIFCVYVSFSVLLHLLHYFHD